MWKTITKQLKQEIGRQSFNNWFTNVSLVKIDDSNIIIEVPDNLHKDHIINHYVDLLKKIIIKETNKNDIKKIIKKIQILNNKSIAEQQKDFLIFYNINLNKKEVEILQYRNKCIHGHIPEDENEIINTEGYISFINRIILKILKYEGDYLDYSFLDPKTKSIDVGIGEGLI